MAHSKLMMDPVEEISKLRPLDQGESREIKNGAYVIIKDNGALYSAFGAQGIARTWCEHTSEMPVYDVPGIIGNVLIGINTHTWLQWERSGCCSLTHLHDWARFICSGKNQGPYGQSLYTDKNPITIQPRVPIIF
jgi:hypothetical protein